MSRINHSDYYKSAAKMYGTYLRNVQKAEAALTEAKRAGIYSAAHIAKLTGEAAAERDYGKDELRRGLEDLRSEYRAEIAGAFSLTRHQIREQVARICNSRMKLTRDELLELNEECNYSEKRMLHDFATECGYNLHNIPDRSQMTADFDRFTDEIMEAVGNPSIAKFTEYASEQSAAEYGARMADRYALTGEVVSCDPISNTGDKLADMVQNIGNDAAHDLKVEQAAQRAEGQTGNERAAFMKEFGVETPEPVKPADDPKSLDDMHLTAAEHLDVSRKERLDAELKAKQTEAAASNEAAAAKRERAAQVAQIVRMAAE